MRKRIRLPALLLLVLHLQACTAWVRSDLSPGVLIPADRPNEVRVETPDGDQVVIEDPEIRSDSIVGASGAGPVALADVTRIDVKQSSTGKTLLLMLLLVGLGYGGFCADYPQSC